MGVFEDWWWEIGKEREGMAPVLRELAPGRNNTKCPRKVFRTPSMEQRVGQSVGPWKQVLWARRGQLQTRWQTGVKPIRTGALRHKEVRRKGASLCLCDLCTRRTFSLSLPTLYRRTYPHPALDEVIVIIFMVFSEKTDSRMMIPLQARMAAKPVSPLPAPDTLLPFWELFQEAPPISCGPGSAGGIFH